MFLPKNGSRHGLTVTKH